MAMNLEPLLVPAIEAEGCILYDLEFVKEGSNRILRIYIDKEEGVGISDCERVSRATEAVLDASDPIPTAYMLEISSPGIERKLTKAEHFARYEGHKVSVRLFAPFEGRRKFTGLLEPVVNDVIAITDENNRRWQFERNQVSVCRLVVFEQ